MTFDEAMMLLKRRKTVAREGRTLRLFSVGFFDVGSERRTDITDADRAATDWKEAGRVELEPEVVAPETVDDALSETEPQ